jgi:dolichol-phosphate mannosyltransferase
MDLASGAAVIIMDADLQDPPEVVGQLIAKWQEGYEVVYAVRERREGETLFKRVTASLFYRVLRRLTDLDIPADVGDFRLVDRKALAAFRSLRENHRFVRGMFSWVGFRQIGVKYRREPRFAGATKYSLRKMWRLASDALLSFSYLPLQFILVLGYTLVLVALVMAGIWGITNNMTSTRLVVVSIFGMGGLQILMTGVMCVYLGRVYEEVKKRPIYVTRALHGFSLDKKPAPAGAVWITNEEKA